MSDVPKSKGALINFLRKYLLRDTALPVYVGLPGSSDIAVDKDSIPGQYFNDLIIESGTNTGVAILGGSVGSYASLGLGTRNDGGGSPGFTGTVYASAGGASPEVAVASYSNSTPVRIWVKDTKVAEFKSVTSAGSPAVVIMTNTTASAEIGYAHVGYQGHADHGGLSHIDQNGATSYAFLQSSVGATYINAASGQAINFRINNSSPSAAQITSAGVLSAGNGATEDGDALFILNSERGWSFMQSGGSPGAASSANLLLKNTTGPNKHFIIQTEGMTKFYNNPGATVKFQIDNATGDNATYGGTKNFNIDHPVRPNYRLVHTSLEGPLCDLVYRGKTTLVDSEGIVDIDDCFGMSAGTFSALTKNPQVFLQNTTGWAPVRVKSFSGAVLTIESNSSDNDEISWMVVATRNDAGVYQSNSTDENGDLIVEFEEPEEP